MKTQVASGLWLAVRIVIGTSAAITLIAGLEALREGGSLVGRFRFAFWMSVVAIVVLLIIMVAREVKRPGHFIRFPNGIYIPAHNLEAASSWYRDKLGCHDVAPIQDDPLGPTVSLALDEDGEILMLGLVDPRRPVTSVAQPSVPTLFTGNVVKARDWLMSRGVAAGPIQRDQERTQYFEFRDLDGNLLEVSEEP